MKKLLIILAFIDFGIGILFGNIGHFYSLLCFPLIAIIRGYMGIATKPKTMRHTILNTVSGASFFLAGLIIGLIMLSSRVPADPSNALMTLSALGQALTLSIITGFIYFAVYMIIGILAGFLCKEVEVIEKAIKKEIREV